MDFLAKRIVIMGLGRFGGGGGAARYLARHGAKVLITDTSTAERLAESITALDGLPIDYRLGKHVEEDFTGADLIIVNPAVRQHDNPFLAAAAAAGVPTTSEIRLLVSQLPDRRRTIGITGTAGKSTVVAMLRHLLRKAPAMPRVHLGGNIGGSLLESLETIRPDDWVVLELSSFMLHGLNADHWSPGVAVVTNCTSNHLDWHRNMANYVAAKQVILKHQKSGDQAVLGESVVSWLTNSGVTRHVVAGDDGEIKLAVPGRHNCFNAACAIRVADAIGVTGDHRFSGLSDFIGLPHRLELVAAHDGVHYVNDSKATTPHAMQIALQSFNLATVHLITGGYDKDVDLSECISLAAQCCRAIYTIGATGDSIADVASVGKAEVIRCQTLDNAVAETTRRTCQGDVVLLSPACPSYDQFSNYEQRGEAFTNAVHGQIKGE